MIASAWLAAHTLPELITAAALCLAVAVAAVSGFRWQWKRHPVPPTHPAARAAALREARSPGRPLDATERAVLARTESQLAADDAEWERVWAVVLSAGEPVR